MTFDDRRRAPAFDEPLPGYASVTSAPQAGAIAVRVGKGEPRVLLMRSRLDPSHWVFPNRPVTPGETPAEAAIRELVEEGGVEGDVIAPAGTVEMAGDQRILRVEYFLVRAGDEVECSGQRERRWCTLREAATLLSFVTSRDMLARVWPLIARPNPRPIEPRVLARRPRR